MRRSEGWRKTCKALMSFLSGVSHPYQRGEKRSFLHHTGSLKAKNRHVEALVYLVARYSVVILNNDEERGVPSKDVREDMRQIV